MPLLLALVFALLLAAPSTAGPNANGVLILSAHDFDYNQPPQCTDDAAVYCRCEPLDRCEDAVVTAPSGYLVVRIAWVYMAFPEGSSPSVAQVSFGVAYASEAGVGLSDGYVCADTETAMPGWPASGTGTVLQFATPASDRIKELCSLVVYSYESYGPQEVRLTPHPELGGYFADGSAPPQSDQVVDYGRLGFQGMEGYLPCPVAPVPVDRRSWGEIKSGVR